MPAANPARAIPALLHRFFPLCILFMIAAVLLSTGCSSGFSGKKKGNRAKLSDAAAQAEKLPEDQEVVRARKTKRKDDPPGRRDDDEEEDDGGGIIGWIGVVIDDEAEYSDPDDDEPPTKERSRKTEPHLWHVGLGLGFGALEGKSFDRYGQASLFFGRSRPSGVRWDLGVSVQVPELTDASGVAGGLINEKELTADFSLRYYFTSAERPTGFYILAGARYGALFWDFAEPIEVDDGYSRFTLRSDNVTFWSPLFGAGVSLMRSEKVQLGLGVALGFKYYAGTTTEGLENDIFEDDAFVQLMLEATIGHLR